MSEIYSSNKAHYTKMLLCHKCRGCFLPGFHFFHIWLKRDQVDSEEYRLQWQKLINYGICHNHPTSKSPRKTFLSLFFFFLKPIHRYRSILFNKVKHKG